MIIIGTGSSLDDHAVAKLNSWCDEHADGQRFEPIDMHGAGGHKVFTDAVFACAGNYFPVHELLKAFETFGWQLAERVVLVVREDSMYSGDARVAIDGRGNPVYSTVDR